MRARRTPPRLRGWTLELAGEPDYVVDPADHDVEARAAQAADDGLDLALVSLSSPLGIETLPPDEAGELLAAYHDGVLALPAPFGGWAAAGLTEIDPSALNRRLEQGFVGLQLPATALLDAAGYHRVGPLLDVLEAADSPLLIHPGLAGGAGPGRAAGARRPGRWRSPRHRGGRRSCAYVQQMHAAWFAFRAYGGRGTPSCGCASRSWPGWRRCTASDSPPAPAGATSIDPGVFLDVSSYGTRAVDATIRVLGIDVLVNGSDRPYADPVRLDLGAAATNAVRGANARRLLYPKEVLDDVPVAAYA